MSASRHSFVLFCTLFYGCDRLNHAPYLSDFCPPVFDLFPKLKKPLREIRFPDLNTLIEKISRRIRELKKDCIQAHPDRR